MYDASQSDTCSITVIATGLESHATKFPGSFGSFRTPVTPASQTRAVVPPIPGRTVMPSGTAAPTQTMPKQAPAYGIQKPGDIRSNVEEKTLNIPTFLQRNNRDK